MSKLLQFANKFEKLLNKLPGALQRPIEKEWRPLKELFLQHRPPRIVIVGQDAEVFARSFLNLEGKIKPGGAGWRTYTKEGQIDFLTVEDRIATAKSAILQAAPDTFIFLGGPGAFDLLKELHTFDEEHYHSSAPIIACGSNTAELSEILHGDTVLSKNVEAVLPPDNKELILCAISKVLADEARLEFARASGEKVVQQEIAGTLTRSAAAVCTAIGAQPIPLADMPILTTLQVLLVSGIIHISGQRFSRKLARDFLAALGVNIGAAFLLREGARAAVKLLPGWGNAVSGAVAGAGTYAIGRAASAYFIEGLSLEQTRTRFRKERKKDLPAPDQSKEQ